MQLGWRIFVGGLMVVGMGWLVGCYQETGGGVPYAELKSRAVLMRVNGEILTKGDLEVEAEMQKKIRATQKSKQQPQDIEFKQIIWNRFADEVMLQQEAHKRGIGITSADWQWGESNLLAYVNRKIPRIERVSSLQSWCKAQQVDFDILKRMLEREISGNLLRKRLYENPPPVTDEYVQGVSNNIAKLNARGVLTNQLVFARATNVWNRLKAGEDWNKLAKQFSEDEDESFYEPGGWGIFSLSAFGENPELGEALAKTEVGGIVPPMEADGGLCITRLDRRIAATDEDAYQHQPSVELSRILFRVWQFYTPGTHDEIVQGANEKWQKQVFKEFYEPLKAATMVEYPCGTNLLTKVKGQKK